MNKNGLKNYRNLRFVGTMRIYDPNFGPFESPEFWRIAWFGIGTENSGPGQKTIH